MTIVGGEKPKVKVIDPKAVEKLEKQIEALRAENNELKNEIEALRAENKTKNK